MIPNLPETGRSSCLRNMRKARAGILMVEVGIRLFLRFAGLYQQSFYDKIKFRIEHSQEKTYFEGVSSMYYVLLTLGLLVASLTCIGNLWMFAIVLPIFGYLYAYPTISRKSNQKSTEQTRDEIKNATTSITKMQVHRQMLQEKADAIKQDQENWANSRKSIENDIAALQHRKESLQKEIFELNRDLTNIQSEITEHINSMYRAEMKSINYMKRLDDKEYALLEEIRRDGDIMKKYGDSIRHDVLAEAVVFGETDGYVKDWDINGEKTALGVKKA